MTRKLNDKNLKTKYKIPEANKTYQDYLLELWKKKQIDKKNKIESLEK